MGLGNIGFTEIMLLLVVVLLLFGAKRIPEIAGSFGKGIKEFKKNMNDVQRDITDSVRDDRIAPPAPRDTLPAGERGAPRDVAVLNAGAGVYAGGHADTLEAGVRAAEEAIDSGAAAAVLEHYVMFTQEAAREASSA